MLKFENHCYSPRVGKLLSVSQLFVFVDKVLLKHIHLHIAYSYFHAKLSSCNRDHMADKSLNIYYLKLCRKKYADLFLRNKIRLILGWG